MEPFKLNNEEILIKNNLLKIVKNKGLSVPSLTKLIKLKTEFSSLTQEYYQGSEAIMEKHGVEKDKKGSFQISASPKAAEVHADLDELLKVQIEIKEARNFLTWEELSTATEGLGADVLENLVPLLIKE